MPGSNLGVLVYHGPFWFNGVMIWVTILIDTGAEMCFYSEERICNMHPRLKKLCEDTNRSGQDVGIQNMNGDGQCKVTAEWIRWGFNLDNPSIAVGVKMRFVKTVPGSKVV